MKENVTDFCVLLTRGTLGPVRGSPALAHSPYLTSPMSTINIKIYSQFEQTIFIKYIYLFLKKTHFLLLCICTNYNLQCRI